MGEKFVEITSLVPEVSQVDRNGPWIFKMGKRQLWSLYYSTMARMVPWNTLETCQNQPFKNSEITTLVLVNYINQTDPFI